MRASFIRVAITILLLSAVVSAGLPAKADEASLVITRLQTGREKLRNGRVKVRQTMNATRPGREQSRSVTEYFCAFDFDKGLHRFDYEVIGRPEFRGKIIRAPENTMTLSPDGYLTIENADKPSSFFYRPFDIRNIGLLDFINLTYEEQKFCSIVQRYRTLAAEQGVAEDATINHTRVTRLTFFADQNRQVRLSLFLDGARDFIPIRFEMQSVTNGQSSRPKFNSVVNVDWKVASQVWVPAVMAFDEHCGSDVTNGELIFSWESVNGPFDGTTFDAERLVKDRTKILDRRRPVQIPRV